MNQDDYLLILDADDTLWESALFFERTEYDFLSLMTSLGLEKKSVLRIVHQRDIERLSITGYGAKPYMDTLRMLLLELVHEPPSWALNAIDDMEKNLLGHPVILFPGVISTLEKLKHFPIRTIVYTMGEEYHQTDKFVRSGLTDHVNELKIVPEKNVNSLREVLKYASVGTQNCIVVGNSPKSDINPAIAMNIPAVFLQRNRTWAAEHEDFSDPERVITISSFEKVLDIIVNFLDIKYS